MVILQKDVEMKLRSIVEKIYGDLMAGEVPELSLPSRTKNNIVLDEENLVWRYGSQMVSRKASSTDGAGYLIKTIYVIEFILDMMRSGKSSTLREMYYISEGWNLGKFHSQSESNLTAEDLEVVSNLLREDFKLRPEENGASVIGNLTIEERNRKGIFKRINCKDDVGDAGYQIPYTVEEDKLRIVSGDADFVLAIETGGMFDRLVENGFDEELNAILVHLKGQPARSTRRLLKRLNTELNLPVIVFTDGDPWSFRIFASVAYGAIKTAHISQYLAVPTAEFVGITATDILTYDLPTDRLSEHDVDALNSELKDPRFNTDFWKSEIEIMLKTGKKAEQQALAKYGLDFVTTEYLPEKLSQLGVIRR